MLNEGPRYNHAARVAAEWLNVHNPDEGTARQFGRLLFLILSAMEDADRELAAMRHSLACPQCPSIPHGRH